MSRATKPRAADVARWVDTLAAPEPGFGDREGRRIDLRDREKARGMLASWGLGHDGQPVKTTGENADTYPMGYMQGGGAS